jgi:hypothetical protein
VGKDRLPPVAVALALTGAVLMPTSLFLHWYAIDREAGGREFDAYPLSGWEVFEATDTLLALAAIAVVVLLLVRPPFAGRVLLVLGALTCGWILVQLIDSPPALSLFDRSEYSLEIGAWLGLLGALLVAAGGALSYRQGDR